MPTGPARVLALASLYNPMRFLDRRIANLNACNLTGVLVYWCDCSPEPVWGEVRDALKGCRFTNRVDHHEERKTLYWTWNWIIRAAGWPGPIPEYVTNVNVDDLHAPDYFSKMTAFMDARKEVMVSAPSWYHSESVVGSWPPPENSKILVPGPGTTMGHFPMWRSAAHREVGLFDPRMVAVGDARFWGRVRRARGSSAFCFLSEPLGCYLLHDSNLYHTSKSPDGTCSGEAWDVSLGDDGVEW